jgi:hypothetical protein
MYECLIEYNRAYTREWTERFAIDWRRIGPCVIAVCALTIAAFGKAVYERRTRDVGVGLTYIGLLAFACAEVFVQRKYFLYHWVVASPFLALVATWALVELVSSVRGAMIATLFSAVLFVAAGALFPHSKYIAYSHHVRATWGYVRGELSLARFNNAFRGPFGNDQAVLRQIAETIRKRAQPDDTLCVRGYMPAIYLYTGLRCPSRFPWEQHLGKVWEPPISSYPIGDIRALWIDEHRHALAIHPPTFLVTFEAWDVDRFMRRTEHYREIAIIDGHVVLQRAREEPLSKLRRARPDTL